MASPYSTSSCWGLPKTDRMQKALLALCLFDLVFFCYYLFNFEIRRQSTISDTLFTTPEYTVVLSVLLAIRMMWGALFVHRFRYKHAGWEIAGYMGVSLALLGWCLLSYFKDNATHFAFVGVFCMGSFLYSLAFVRLAATTEDHLEMVHASMEGCLLLAVVVLVISFVTLWMEEDMAGDHKGGGAAGGIQHAYIVEHAAYIVQLVFYAGFFLYHTPDPRRLPGRFVGEEYDQGFESDGVAMVCRPLILQERLPVILEMKA